MRQLPLFDQMMENHNHKQRFQRPESRIQRLRKKFAELRESLARIPAYGERPMPETTDKSANEVDFDQVVHRGCRVNA